MMTRKRVDYQPHGGASFSRDEQYDELVRNAFAQQHARNRAQLLGEAAQRGPDFAEVERLLALDFLISTGNERKCALRE